MSSLSRVPKTGFAILFLSVVGNLTKMCEPNKHKQERKANLLNWNVCFLGIALAIRIVTFTQEQCDLVNESAPTTALQSIELTYCCNLYWFVKSHLDCQSAKII